ncbi:MAG TPA: thiamine pyrophosphate-dependent enzyme [Desulfuromonadales bacterium]|nr:thiamine pyrophosphate-dependent enzyme [Desulfuromonadales bacterium]
MMKQVFAAPASLKDVQTHFCPGCQHGLVHRLVGDAMDHFDVQQETIGVASVGCSVFLYEYFDIDVVEAPHGRAPAVATGVKRVHGDKVVFTYQGDGDLAAIGTSEIIHAANRGENFTALFVNNTTYGMTGGQMAPTSLPGQRTSTSSTGRDVQVHGYPIRMSELMAGLEGVAYSVRVAVNTPQNVIKAGKAIRKAFDMQLQGKGFAFVEVLASCPTNWGMNPLEANERVAAEMVPYFPLGTYKDISA